jgi:tRNA pseudouridine38-40 synthase
MSSKHRFFVEIAYKGTAYHGWQRQPNVPSVQQTLEETLSKALHQNTVCIGCGRTDTMVHASQYYFHFDYDQAFGFDLKHRLNKMLPDDISILSVNKVEGKPHAQFTALARTYNYFIHTHKNPYLADISSLYSNRFDTKLMAHAVELISTQTDFINFCRSPSKNSSTQCQISSARLYTNRQAGIIKIEITANRFLQGMIRIIVQRIIDVGSGELPINQFEQILTNRIKPKKVIAAYPQGLHLTRVDYPDTLDLNGCSPSPFFSILKTSKWGSVGK